MLRNFYQFVVAILCVGLVGCGGGGSGGGNQSGAVSRTFGPAGGTLSSADGRATLTIPPGALSSDATVTMRRVTDMDPYPVPLNPDLTKRGASSAYEVKTTGTFAAPLTLRLRYDARAIPNGGREERLRVYPVHEFDEITAGDHPVLDAAAKTVAGDVTIPGTFAILVDSQYQGQYRVEYDDGNFADVFRVKPSGHVYEGITVPPPTPAIITFVAGDVGLDGTVSLYTGNYSRTLTGHLTANSDGTFSGSGDWRDGDRSGHWTLTQESL